MSQLTPESPFMASLLKIGDAANYANYQQGVTFWSIRVSVRWKLTHTVFNELITTRTLGHFFI